MKNNFLYIYFILFSLGFSAKSQSVSKNLIQNYKKGGYVVYEKNGHGLVVSIYNLGPVNFSEVDAILNKFKFGGYTDWRLPTKDEVIVIYKNVISNNDPYEFNYWLNPILSKATSNSFVGCLVSKQKIEFKKIENYDQYTILLVRSFNNEFK
jgi:hypothetical protein